MIDQLNQSGQLSNSQDGCQTNSRRYDSFTTGPVRSAIPSNSWASCSNIVKDWYQLFGITNTISGNSGITGSRKHPEMIPFSLPSVISYCCSTEQLSYLTYSLHGFWNYHCQSAELPPFYRVMHYSAKHGLGIACRLSIRLSVTLVDHDYRLDILETNCANNQPNFFALCRQKIVHLLPGKHGEILGRLGVGW